MARDYELGLIINPDVGDDQARAIVDRVNQTIASEDGQVVRVNAWGRRRLAYPIDHHRDGLYFFFDLILAPESVAELERTLRVNEAVLRHIVKVRDPRIVEQQRQREAEAEALAAAQAAQVAQAAQATASEQAPGGAMPAATEAEAPAEAAIPAETATAEAGEAGEAGQTGGTEPAGEPADEVEAATEAEANG